MGVEGRFGFCPDGAHAEGPVGGERGWANGGGQGIVFVAAHDVIGGGEDEALDGRAAGCDQRDIEGHVDGDGRFVPAGVGVGIICGEVNDRLYAIECVAPAAVAGIGEVAFEQFDGGRRACRVLRSGVLQCLQLIERRRSHVQPYQKLAGRCAGQVQQQFCAEIAKAAGYGDGTRGRDRAVFSCRRADRRVTLFLRIESQQRIKRRAGQHIVYRPAFFENYGGQFSA